MKLYDYLLNMLQMYTTTTMKLYNYYAKNYITTMKLYDYLPNYITTMTLYDYLSNYINYNDVIRLLVYY